MCSYFVEKAENATLWDIEGNEVIDFAAGIAVLNTGHRHPKSLPPLNSSCRPLPTAYQIVPYESYVTLAERINELAPIDGPAKTAFFTTGAEAVENAVKIARLYRPSGVDYLRRRLPRPYVYDHGADR
jgi:4-aminobutyrate aminotransferase